MNGRLFDKLVALHEVCLKSNECININFDKTIHLEFLGKSLRRLVTFESMCRKDISSIRSELDAKCGYEEIDSKVFCKETCGAVSYTSGAIVNGNKTVRGQWFVTDSLLKPKFKSNSFQGLSWLPWSLLQPKSFSVAPT